MHYRFIPFLIGMTSFAHAEAPLCSTEKIAEILAPASTKQQVTIDCSTTLPAGSTITKTLLFSGPVASDITFDCNNAKIISQKNNTDNVLISSIQQNGQWLRPQNLELRHCNIQGALRINGMNDDALRIASRQENATATIQAAAPTHITLDQVNISGNGRVPLYLRPGTTYITIKNSLINGQSKGPAVYFDMESANNLFENNIVEVKNQREQFAVDGSAHNIIRNNRFLTPKNGGIFLYRNCGERGIIRQQTPSSNLISDNYFANRTARFYRPMIWIASRNGGQSYCKDDAGYPFGSSSDDRDFPENNQIINNRFDKFWAWFTIRQNWQPNQISNNHRK
ncbi:MAG: NosD domain-containing protein [Neisseria sp.]|uniref:right-handed parallel beta-helix repeat-containing protein n=1 Tax=Neisseria sp. TaxID=192066 RepID=UPI0026DB715B|nr:NosD domain-containing protein [Neisseria sp.]MDO4642142.1 NosD domain-containing protein [Neisseria sp.]